MREKGEVAMPTRDQTGSCVGHYQIICPLGGWVASQVYRPQDGQTGAAVVLRFPIDDIVGGAAISQRFQREAENGVVHRDIQPENILLSWASSRSAPSPSSYTGLHTKKVCLC